MPGVSGYQGNPYAGGGGAYGAQYDYDPYSRGGGGGRDVRGPPARDNYDRRAETQYQDSRPNSGAGRPRSKPAQQNGRRYPEPEMRGHDPYAVRGPPEDPYSRGNKPEDPYSRGNKPEDPYGRVNKSRQNGAAPGYVRSFSTENEGMRSSGFPSFEMDHLATFTVGSKQGLMSAADGIRKLRQMEMSTGIWTMRVLLIIEPDAIVIFDRASNEEMERFPVYQVHEPTAVTNEDRRDVYNNIVLFTVTEDSHRGAPAEMHMFQSVAKPAHTVVDEIKEAKSGKQSKPERVSDLPPQQPIRRYMPEHDPLAERNSRLVEGYDQGDFMKPRPRDTESVISEHTDHGVRRPIPRNAPIDPPRDPAPRAEPARGPRASAVDPDDLDIEDMTAVDAQQLLNHCFDDIERFVGRLQYAAEAYRELENRRHKSSDRKGNRNSKHGMGMLSMRARPPPAKDFIDIFQKFKLSFNLLAKLKPHIHDPNAPELVHFLFTPLSLVVEASKDPRHGTPDIAAKVVAPLLTPDAKDLLINCLTSKEADLWHSLGEAWRLNRDEWKGYVPPFNPRFSDGWAPPRSWNPEPEENRQEVEDPYRDSARYNGAPPQASRPDPYQRDPNREAHRRAQQEFEAEYQRRQERQERERQERDRQDREMEERLRENQRPREPERVREPRYSQEARPPMTFEQEVRARGGRTSVALHSREGRNNKEVSVQKGEVLEVLDSSRNWWKVRNAKGEVGHAPYTILDSNAAQASTSTQPSPEDKTNWRGSVAPAEGDELWPVKFPPSERAQASPSQPPHREEEFVYPHSPSPRADQVLDEPVLPERHTNRNSAVYNNQSPYYNQSPVAERRAPPPIHHQQPSPRGIYQQDEQPSPRGIYQQDEPGYMYDPIYDETAPPVRRDDTPSPQPIRELEDPPAGRPRSPSTSPYNGVNPPYHRADSPYNQPEPPRNQQTEPPFNQYSDPAPESPHNNYHDPHRDPPGTQYNNPPPSKKLAHSPSKLVHNIMRTPLQDNLSNELRGFQKGAGPVSPRHVVIPKSPDIQIDSKSSPSEVLEWLRVKGFSNRLQDALSGYSGYDILNLTTNQIRGLTEDDRETARLEGQITLIKNRLGLSIEKSQELQAVLRSRKQEVEPSRSSSINRW